MNHAALSTGELVDKTVDRTSGSSLVTVTSRAMRDGVTPDPTKKGENLTTERPKKKSDDKETSGLLAAR